MLMSRSRMEYRLSTLSLQGIVLLGALEIGTMHFFRHCLIQLRGHFANCPVAQRSKPGVYNVLLDVTNLSRSQPSSQCWQTCYEQCMTRRPN
jgi:hypothetical protein